MDIRLQWFRMGNWPEPKNYESEMTESDFLPSISFEKFQVGGEWWWVVHWDYSISSAPFLTELKLWELSFEQRRWVIDLSLNIMRVRWQRVIFCLLSALKSFGWWWVVHWDYNVSSAPFVMSVSWWRVIFCLLSAMKSFGWVVGGALRL